MNRVSTTVSNWREEDGKLFRRFEFANFNQALDFVNKVGDLAEKAGHHPDIEFGWGYATVRLSTHDVNDITQKDRGLAEEIDRITS